MHVLRSTMRLALFTDTLGDVNGVSRFIRNLADTAHRLNSPLRVLTSTRLPIPEAAYYTNIAPIWSCRMPRYHQLQLAFPPARAMLAEAAQWRPDVIHVSTPGPVGLTGRWIAGKLGVPLVGTYHTDFPAYVEHLFDDAVLGNMTAAAMAWFYKPFRAVFSRSREYMESMERLGISRARMHSLRAGMDTTAFHPRFRDRSVWSDLGGTDPGVVVLSCGRVSVEKNLPLLAQAWLIAQGRLDAMGIRATLAVVGDGPYLPALREQLAGARALFLGFRHGEELSRLYASSDVLAFPSHTDTLGQVVMEAQASGIPAIVSDIGGPRSLIIEDRTGVVVRKPAPRVWADAIVGLASDPARRSAMALAAREHMSAYGFEDSFRHFWDVHRGVVAQN